MRNSPTKLLVPGKAREDREKKVKKVDVDGHEASDAGGGRQIAAVGALVDHAHAEEQRAGGYAVIDHLQNGPFDAALVEHEDAQGDEAHVAHARVGDELFHVLLGQRGETAVDDARDAQPLHEGQHVKGGLGSYGQAEAQKAVGAHFQKNRGQNDAARCGSFDVARPATMCGTETWAP